jgi:hypothetical protein
MCYKSNILRSVNVPRAVAVLIALLLGSTGLGAADDTASAFVGRLRAAIAAAAMFRYPLRVNAPSLPLPIPLDNATSTVQMYDLLFTPEMRCAIELAQVPKAGSPAPKFPVFVNGDALTLGKGL